MSILNSSPLAANFSLRSLQHAEESKEKKTFKRLQLMWWIECASDAYCARSSLLFVKQIARKPKNFITVSGRSRWPLKDLISNCVEWNCIQRFCPHQAFARWADEKFTKRVSCEYFEVNQILFETAYWFQKLGKGIKESAIDGEINRSEILTGIAKLFVKILNFVLMFHGWVCFVLNN